MYILGQTEMLDLPSTLPVWAYVVIAILYLLVQLVIPIVLWRRVVSEGKWRDVAQQNETKLAAIQADRDRDVSQNQMTREILAVHREELGKIMGAIREAATINREGDTELQKLLDRNTTVIGELSSIIKSVAIQLQNVSTSIMAAENTGKATIASNEALQADTMALHSDVKQQIAVIGQLMTHITEIKAEIKATAKQGEFAAFRDNMLEIFDGLESDVQTLSDVVQRLSNTQPLPELVIPDDESDNNNTHTENTEEDRKAS